MTIVRTLHRKLVRDLWRLRGQVGAITLVMACGVATFVMALSMLDSLQSTLTSYYDEGRFADVFVHVKRAPQTMEERLATIPGVAQLETRVVERVLLDLPTLPEPASGQIVSLPRDNRGSMHQLHLRSGRFPEGRFNREVLVSERFAAAHDLHPGDTVDAILNGRLQALRITGVALSPEFIYLISPGSVLPDDRRFGVFWMGREELDAAFDMDGAFNDAIIRLAPRASEAEVIDQIDALLDRYGGLGAYGREDQTSHKFVANEIDELRGMTLVTPVIFLGVAAFLLNIVLSRLIAVQREQIAALKALGYGSAAIGRHYLGFVSIIVLLAVVVGTGAGAQMGRGLTRLYSDFFNFPTFVYRLRANILLLAVLVTSAAAAIGVLSAVRAAIRLPPAEAMRPKAPASFRPTVLERVGAHRALTPATRMILRQLERRPVKTALSILGVALATSILIVGSFAKDAIDFVVDFQFNQVQRYDLNVVMHDRIDDSGCSTIRDMTGVIHTEPYRTVAARIRHGHRERRLGVMGLPSSTGLHAVLDMRGRSVELPEHGVLISSTLARALHVVPGDTVIIEALEGRRPIFEAPVGGIIEEFTGLSAYMRLSELLRLMREENTFGGVFIDADEGKLDQLFQELHDSPQVAAVNLKSATVQSFEETIAKNLLIMRTFVVSFAVVIAFGVVYNSARISLSERSRDLATLRVIGFTRREISVIQLGELAIITGIAVPVGLGLGYALSWWASIAMQSELFNIPLVIDRSTYVTAALVVSVAAIASGLIVRRRIDRLDLVSVLKARE